LEQPVLPTFAALTLNSVGNFSSEPGPGSAPTSPLVRRTPTRKPLSVVPDGTDRLLRSARVDNALKRTILLNPCRWSDHDEDVDLESLASVYAHSMRVKQALQAAVRPSDRSAPRPQGDRPCAESGHEPTEQSARFPTLAAWC
jgi:hypothetical protein